MKIEVGMLVEIIDAPDFITGRCYIGHQGKVTGFFDYRGIRVWRIDGAEINPENGHELFFNPTHLRPIPPKRTNPDITQTQERGCGDWPFLKSLLIGEKENETEKG